MIASDGINLLNSIPLHTTLLTLFKYTEKYTANTFCDEEDQMLKAYIQNKQNVQVIRANAVQLFMKVVFTHSWLMLVTH